MENKNKDRNVSCVLYDDAFASVNNDATELNSVRTMILLQKSVHYDLSVHYTVTQTVHCITLIS